MFKIKNNKNYKDVLITIKKKDGNEIKGNYEKIYKKSLIIKKTIFDNYLNKNNIKIIITLDLIDSVFINNTSKTKLGFYNNLWYFINKLNKDVINLIIEYIFPDYEYIYKN